MPSRPEDLVALGMIVISGSSLVIPAKAGTTVAGSQLLQPGEIYRLLIVCNDFPNLMQPHCQDAHGFVIMLGPDVLLATLRRPSPVFELCGTGLV
jgi:hypothetical protein